MWCTSILTMLRHSAAFPILRWRCQRIFSCRYTNLNKVFSFVRLVVFSDDGATCERVGISAEDAGPWDGQSCHCWQDGLHTQHPGLTAAVRYRIKPQTGQCTQHFHDQQLISISDVMNSFKNCPMLIFIFDNTNVLCPSLTDFILYKRAKQKQLLKEHYMT